MIETIQETPSQSFAAKIFDVAATLWPKILQHKWLMSEKYGRDVGLRAACIDFVERMDRAIQEYACRYRIFVPAGCTIRLRAGICQ
ncbi:MAG: DUF4032 domain-containing protein [Thermodesulfovibrionales bacterium]